MDKIKYEYWDDIEVIESLNIPQETHKDYQLHRAKMNVLEELLKQDVSKKLFAVTTEQDSFHDNLMAVQVQISPLFNHFLTYLEKQQ